MQAVAKKLSRFIHTHELIILLALFVIVLRIPNLFEPYWYGDEGIYLLVGQALRRGVSLYAEIIDHKTPLIYLYAAIAGNLVFFKCLLIIFSVVSLVLFHQLVRRFKLPFITTVIFALLTTLPALEGNIVNGELMLMPFILGAVWLFWGSASPKHFAVGALFSLALLTKVPAGFDFAALMFFWLFFLFPRDSAHKTKVWLNAGLFLILGFITPVLISVLFFLLKGDLNDYLSFGLLYNFHYMSSWNSPFSHPVLQFLTSFLGRSVFLLAFLAILYKLKTKLSAPVAFTLIWFGFAFFASILSLRPYPHYLIQVVPAACLAVGFLFTQKRFTRIVVASVLITSFVVITAFGFKRYPSLPYYRHFLAFITHQMSEAAYYQTFDQKTTQTYALASWLIKHTALTDRVFIWGDEPMVYALSRRLPLGRFSVAFHIASFDAYKETLSAIQQEKPKYILDTYNNYDSFPDLYSILTTRYIPLEKIGGATIYQRLPDSLP